ncbi:hypothetical protein ILUMI_08381 [Ignelater luminosus]|uniref:Medium-chain acyl-CoA ligase ACSF2, mitochondrial n=1 Tax=Ignelater luminosus TaxID=2038154 RepID=A0A8K0GFG6_IGNLU|nr:hypothetical protein ILUMI_08381 [Ignelater luminosus]
MIRSVRGFTIRIPSYLKNSLRCTHYHTKLSYRHNPGKEPLRSLTVGNLIQLTAERYPERMALISKHQNDRLTYQELLEKADEFAAGLQSLGLNRGDRIGVWASNITEWIISMFAILRGGYIIVPMHINFQTPEIEYCINKVRVKALICQHKTKDCNLYDLLKTLAPELERSDPGKLNCDKIPSLSTIITIGEEKLKGTYNFKEIPEKATPNLVKSIKENQHLVQPDHPYNIQFTSGTTGKPKAAMISHFQVVNNSYSIGKRCELDTKYHSVCVQSPLFHGFGTSVTTCSAINFGSTLVLPSSTYSPLENLKAISEERCTVIHGTPTMYVDLVNIQKQLNLKLNAEIALSGGAVCSPHLFKQMKETLKLKRVKSGYGLTEATAVIFQSLPIDEDEYKATSTVGYIGDHLEVKVVDDDNNIVPIGTPGELCLRGYSVMLGYWEEEEKTKEVLGADRWMKTGDQFVLQEDGYGRIVGRLKDLIIRGGTNIYPKEIEDFLNTHPEILEAHVIGLKHERLGEEVCACVRLKEGAQLTHESLIEFCTGNIAKYKIPSKLEIMDTLPKTLSGKIQKYLLRQQFEK